MKIPNCNIIFNVDINYYIHCALEIVNNFILNCVLLTSLSKNLSLIYDKNEIRANILVAKLFIEYKVSVAINNLEKPMILICHIWCT